MDELVTNGPIVAESCLALGLEAAQGGERFFAWLGSTYPIPKAGPAGTEQEF